jgi:4-amino-4-deoxy-L-arabinose transferase-like glycosyltransferase
MPVEATDAAPAAPVPGADGGGRIERARHTLALWWAGIDPAERLLLAGAMALSAAIVVAYVLVTKPNGLAGDQSVYDDYGRFWADGKLWWSDLPYGVAHASAWKAPLYPAFVGIVYDILGPSPTKVAAVQGLLLAPLTVLGGWLLARRLFGRRTAIASAFALAIFPASWEFIGLMYPEALAVPVTLLALNLFWDRPPTTKLAIATGLAIGLGMLVRPNLFFLFAGALGGWWILAGPKQAFRGLAIAVAAAVLLILPWTVRNLSAADGFVPISIQDAAVYGTFNDTAANDPTYPYQWRAYIDPMPEVLEGPPQSDYVVRRELIGDATDYISEHPDSVPKAFFWNGLSRFWDIRRPQHAIDEISTNGQSKGVAIPGLVLYWIALALALWGLWLFRARRAVVIPILLIALAASITVIPDASTRYRAPLEPLIVILACAAPIAALGRGRPGSPAGPGPNRSTQ